MFAGDNWILRTAFEVNYFAPLNMFKKHHHLFSWVPEPYLEPGVMTGLVLPHLQLKGGGFL